MILPSLRDWCALTAFHGIGIVALEKSGQIEEAWKSFLFPLILSQIATNNDTAAISISSGGCAMTTNF